MPKVQLTRDNFKSYHRNHYLLELNEAWIAKCAASQEKTEFQEQVLKYIGNKLIVKNAIDTDLLNRKEHIRANADKLTRINAALGKNEYEPIIADDNTAYTTTIKRNISDINSHRLDMVWSRALIETLIRFFGFYAPELSRLIGVIALVNGLASYGFYVLRGGADALPGLLHLGTSEKYDDLEISFWDRLAFQSEQRYQRIINDLILWAPVNYITFHHWTGNGWLGFAGNLLTAVLLLADYTLNCYVYYDKIRQYNLIIEELEKKFGTHENWEAYKNELQLAHQHTLDNIKFETTYQIALVASFVLLWSPFCLNSMVFTVIGAVACFGLQLFINQRNMYLNYSNETNEYQKKIIFYEGLNRLLIQLAIPSVYLITGLVFMPMLPMVSAPIMFGLATAMIAMLLKTNEQYMALFKADNKENSVLEEVEKATEELNDTLFTFGCASMLSFFTMSGLVQTGLLTLNPALGIGLAAGCLCYFTYEYFSNQKQEDHAPKLV